MKKANRFLIALLLVCTLLTICAAAAQAESEYSITFSVDDNYIRIFEDETDVEVSMNTDSFGEDVTFEWQLGSYAHGDEEGATWQEETDGCSVDESNVLHLDGSVLACKVNKEERYLVMRVSALQGENTLAQNELTIDAYQNEYYIEEPWEDQEILLGKNYPGVPTTVKAYVRDSAHQNGEWLGFRVQDVSVANAEEEEDAPCTVAENETLYEITATACGTAVVTVTYFNSLTEEDVKREFRLYICDEKLSVDLSWAECTSHMPRSNDSSSNRTKRVIPIVTREWNYSFEDQGDESISDFQTGIATDEEGNPCYDTDKISVSVMDDGKTVEITSGTEDGVFPIQIKVSATIDKGTDNEHTLETFCWINVTVCGQYYCMDPIEVNPCLNVGVEATFKPVAYHVTVTEDGSVVKTELSDQDPVRFSYHYHQDCIRLTNGENDIGEPLAPGQQVRVVRKDQGATSFLVDVLMWNSEQQEWSDVAFEQWVDLDKLDYQLSVPGLTEPENGCTWIFDEEPQTFAPVNNLSEFYSSEEMSGFTTTYFVYLETEDDPTELEAGYTVQDGSITIDAAALIEEYGMDDLSDGIYVRVQVVNNDYVVTSYTFRVFVRESIYQLGFEPNDVTLLPGDIYLISKTQYGRVENTDNPMGAQVVFDVTRVSSSNNVCTVTYHEEGKWWEITANKLDSGFSDDAEITVEISMDDEVFRTVNFKITVSSDTICLFYSYPHGSNDLLPGETMKIPVKVLHAWYRDGQYGNEYTEDFSLALEETNDYGDLLSIEYDSENSQLSVTANEGNGPTCIRVTALLTLDEGTENERLITYEDSIAINVSNVAYYISNVDFNQNLLIGQSVLISPRLYRVEMTADSTEMKSFANNDRGIRFTLHYPEGYITVTDAEGNTVESDSPFTGETLTVKRECVDEMSIHYHAYRQIGDDDWQVIKEYDITLPRLDYRIWPVDSEGNELGRIKLYPNTKTSVQMTGDFVTQYDARITWDAVITNSNGEEIAPGNIYSVSKSGIITIDGNGLMELQTDPEAAWFVLEVSARIDNIKTASSSHILYWNVHYLGENGACTVCNQTFSLKNLSVVYTPEALQEISAETFCGIAADAIYVNTNCGSIGSKAFTNCSGLQYVFIPGKLDKDLPGDAVDENVVIIYY